MLEYYAAYWNYEDNMAFTEALLQHAIQEAVGTLQIERGGQIDRLRAAVAAASRLRDVILENSGIDIDEHHDADVAAQGDLRGEGRPRQSRRGPRQPHRPALQDAPRGRS